MAFQLLSSIVIYASKHLASRTWNIIRTGCRHVSPYLPSPLSCIAKHPSSECLPAQNLSSDVSHRTITYDNASRLLILKANRDIYFVGRM